jgi:hypothetical protein
MNVKQARGQSLRTYNTTSKITGNEISHLRLLPYFEIQQFNTTSSLYTLYKLIWLASLRYAANTSGGEFRSRSLEVFAALLDATKGTRKAHIKWLVLVEYNFADLVNQPKCHHVYYVQSHLVKFFISGYASCGEDRITVRGAGTHIGSVFATMAPSDEASGIKYTYSGGPIAPA